MLWSLDVFFISFRLASSSLLNILLIYDKQIYRNFCLAMKEPNVETALSVLRAVYLSVHFGGVKAVQNVTFEVNEGEVFSIVGPNGAGKTTIFNLVSRIYDVTTGHIHFAGQDITQVATHRVAELGIARTFQNTELRDSRLNS